MSDIIPGSTVKCEKCGTEYAVGDWYQCPHGRYRGTVVPDDIPGGFVQEHFGHHPETFYSKKAMLKRADELGLRPMVKNAGPHDKHVAKWASVDLEGATALVSRMGRPAKASEVICETAQFTVTEVK